MKSETLITESSSVSDPDVDVKFEPDDKGDKQVIDFRIEIHKAKRGRPKKGAKKSTLVRNKKAPVSSRRAQPERLPLKREVTERVSNRREPIERVPSKREPIAKRKCTIKNPTQF